MSANSESEFLKPILVTSGYDPDVQDCSEFLASLCEGESHQAFLEICYELFKVLITFPLLLPAPRLPDSVLETVASDLHTVLVPLWGLQLYSDLVGYVRNAQDMAVNACGEKSKKTRGNYVTSCFDALDRAYKYLSGILPKDA